MNRLDQFLNIAARQMRIMPATLRDDELRELRGHLEQRVEDYIGAGMSQDAAQMRALEGLGSPRALGAQLCDAWEGIAFSWWRLAAAIVGVTAFLTFGIVAFLFALLVIWEKTESALLPGFEPLLLGSYMALPLLCGLLFSHWLGRRGCIVAPLYFLVLALNNLKVGFPTESQNFTASLEKFSIVANASWFAYLWVALALAGAWMGQSWRLKKRHQLAFIGAHPQAPSRFLWVPLNLIWWRNAASAILVCGAIYAGPVWLSFHPQTPEATLRNYLFLNRQMNFGKFEPPQILATRELPAQSPAEIAGTQKRIWFKIEASMTPVYKTRQLEWRKKLLASARQRELNGVEMLELQISTARIRRNREPLEGVALLKKTAAGWNVEMSDESFPSWKMWAWATVIDPSSIQSEPNS